MNTASAPTPEGSSAGMCAHGWVKMLSTIPAESIGFESSKSDSKKMSSPYEGEPTALADIRQDLTASFLNKGMSQEEAEEQVEFILNL